MSKAKAIEKILEFINQHSEGSCPLCGAEDYPVKGDKKGYEKVSSDEAEEWNLDHHTDCPVKTLELLLKQPEPSEFTKLARSCIPPKEAFDNIPITDLSERPSTLESIIHTACDKLDEQAEKFKKLKRCLGIQKEISKQLQDKLDKQAAENEKLREALAHYDQVIRGLDETNEMLQAEIEGLKAEIVELKTQMLGGSENDSCAIEGMDEAKNLKGE